jgi:hypothetical protein
MNLSGLVCPKKLIHLTAVHASSQAQNDNLILQPQPSSNPNDPLVNYSRLPSKHIRCFRSQLMILDQLELDQMQEICKFLPGSILLFNGFRSPGHCNGYLPGI